MRSFFLCAASIVAVKATLEVDIRKDGTFGVTVDGPDAWMTSDDVQFLEAGKVMSAAAGSLVLTDDPASYNGSDGFGEYTATQFNWKSTSNAQYTTRIRLYRDEQAVFEQVWVSGVDQAAGQGACKDSVVSSFPSFVFNGSLSSSVGFVAWDGDMVGSDPVYGRIGDQLPSGIKGTGPIVFFRDTMASSVAFGPASEFFSASYDWADGHLRCGPFGNASAIPAGFSMEFMLSSTRHGGVNRPMVEYGRSLLARFETPEDRADADFTLQALQYSTDNGAVYYYNTEVNKTYQQTLIDVKHYADQANIPYRTVLLDSWWYFKGPDNGVTEWVARPDIFPDGSWYVYNQTQWKSIGHNRYWSYENVYAKQNGGSYEFVQSGDHMLPVETRFWVDLFRNSSWGLSTYEQDWLDNETDDVWQLTSNVTLGRMWLRQMGEGAAQTGLQIQYCMSHQRHMLQSVEIPQVTQARSSGDYCSNCSDQWQIGVSGLFAHAIGIMPSKDNYWSEPDQPAAFRKYHDDRTEPRTRLESAVSSLSRGPVAPSDQVGRSDRDIVIKACRDDGILLRPDRPATAIDKYFAHKAFGFDHPAAGGVNGEVWSTETMVSHHLFAHVIAVDVTKAFELVPRDFGFEFDPDVQLVAIEANTTSAGAGFAPVLVSSSTPLQVPESDQINFPLFHLSPIDETSGYALLGQLDKWIPTSADRYSDLQVTPSGMTVLVKGVEGEVVTTSFVHSSDIGTLVQVTCRVPPSGSVEVAVPAATCRTS